MITEQEANNIYDCECQNRATMIEVIKLIVDLLPQNISCPVDSEYVTKPVEGVDRGGGGFLVMGESPMMMIS
jgi:hypothetical protein